jgi:hypothetical protein
MNDRLEDLRRQLDQKTTEIESLVAAEQGLGGIGSMDPSDYERLQQYVEELLEQWEEDGQDGSGNDCGTVLRLNRRYSPLWEKA